MKKTKSIQNKAFETGSIAPAVVPFKAVMHNGFFYVERNGFLIDKFGKSSQTPHIYRSLHSAQNAADFLNKTAK